MSEQPSKDQQKNRGGQENKEPKATKAHWSISATLIILLLIVVCVVVGYGLFIDKLTEFQDRQRQAEAELRVVMERNQQLLLAVQQVQHDTEQMQVKVPNREALRVLEYLIKMAEVTFASVKDSEVAASFLRGARNYAAVYQFKFLLESIDRDLAQLAKWRDKDYPGVTQQLDKIIRQVQELPKLATALADGQVIEEKLKMTPIRESNWFNRELKQGWQKIVQSLKNLVVIERVVPAELLSFEQEQLLRFNLELKLIQAQFALLHQQSELYQSCLDYVIMTLTHYYGEDFTVSQEMVAKLIKLKNEGIPSFTFKLETPTTISAFQQKMNEQGVKQSITLTFPEEQKIKSQSNTTVNLEKNQQETLMILPKEEVKVGEPL